MPCTLKICGCDARMEGDRRNCRNFQEPGSVPPTQDPGPKPEGGACRPPVEAFPAADFQMAQRALREVRAGLGFSRDVLATMPIGSELRIDTDRMRSMMQTIITRFENAERACMQLGLPF